MKKLRLIIKIVIILLIVVTLLVSLSIPIAKLSEGLIANPGMPLTKIVFRHATIIPLDSNYVLRDYSLYISDNKIEAILPDSLPPRAGYTEINAAGKYILPGLVDMHAHIFDRTDLTNYLSYGVTQVRNMMGFPMHLRWKSQWEQGRFPGSKMITASPTLNDGEDTDPFHKTFAENEDVVTILKEYQNDGYDFYKIYDGLSKEQFTTIMQAAKELQMTVVGHAPIAVPREILLQSGLTSFEHMEEIYNNFMNRRKDDSLASVIAKEFAQTKKPICVTLSAYHHIYLASNHREEFLKQTPYEQINPLLIFIGNRLLSDYLEPSDKLREAVASKRAYLTKLTKLFFDEGAVLIFGTDTGPSLTVPGLTVHEELNLLHEAGLPNYNIIKSATVDPLKLLDGVSNPVGIQVGADADLLLVENNPLEDLETLKNPKLILLAGVTYDSEAISNLRSLGQEKMSVYASIGNLLQQFFNK